MGFNIEHRVFASCYYSDQIIEFLIKIMSVSVQAQMLTLSQQV